MYVVNYILFLIICYSRSEGLGVYSSMHGMKDTNVSQDQLPFVCCNLTQKNRKSFTLQVTPMGYLFPLIHLTCMSSDYVKNLNSREKTPCT